MSNAARRDAPPGNCAANQVSRGLAVSRCRVAAVAALVVVIAASAACAAKRSPAAKGADRGILACAPTAGRDLLSADALQCWFVARHGRWRTLSQESHYTVLVVRVEVESPRDAADIARRFVSGQSAHFSEILLYAQPVSAGERIRTRRVRWTADRGFEQLDF